MTRRERRETFYALPHRNQNQAHPRHKWVQNAKCIEAQEAKTSESFVQTDRQADRRTRLENGKFNVLI